MFYLLVTILLAPVFIIQGRYVRRVTPKLPEAAGARSGEVGSGELLRLLVIGDSAAAGVGVETQREALTGQLVDGLKTHYQVAWVLMAKTGDTSADILHRLKIERECVFDAVVISMGVNDVTSRTSSKEWLANLNCISKLLRTKFAAKTVYLSNVPPMHNFPALPQPLRWWLGVRAKKLNLLMKCFASSEEGVSYIDLSYPFKAEYIAADGFHPGAAAYKLWGGHVATSIESHI